MTTQKKESGFIGLVFREVAVLKKELRVNEHGNTIHALPYPLFNMERYQFDFNECTPDKGWEQYDTDQDAWYFGVWIHREKRMTVTFAEGDFSVVTCPTSESFRAEIEGMNEFYGDPPAHTKAIDTETGQVTHYIQERPEV